MDNLLDSKITYNNYEVLSVKILNNVIFVKTLNKASSEIIWFLGFKTRIDLATDVKRILAEDHKYRNSFFKEMFKEDYNISKVSITFDESKLIQRRRKGIC